MKPPDGTRTRAEDEFHQWLDLFREGKAPDVDEYVREHPAEIQRELRRMIEDYHGNTSRPVNTGLMSRTP